MTRQDMINLLMMPLNDKCVELKADVNCELSNDELDMQLGEFKAKYEGYTDLELRNMVMINY